MSDDCPVFCNSIAAVIAAATIAPASVVGAGEFPLLAMPLVEDSAAAGGVPPPEAEVVGEVPPLCAACGAAALGELAVPPLLRQRRLSGE